MVVVSLQRILWSSLFQDVSYYRLNPLNAMMICLAIPTRRLHDSKLVVVVHQM